MKKIALTLILLLGSAIPSRAQRETSAFVGNFGQTILFPADWDVTARMLGEAEEIRFHPRRLYTPTGSIPFQPKPGDYKVENYTSLHLMTLMVVPRSVSAFEDIADLKKAKIADLEGKAGFRIIDNPAPAGYWPEGAFEVRISTPYRLRQLYTFNDSHRFILTWGEDEVGTEMYDGSGLVKTSLAKLMKLPADPDPSTAAVEEGMAQAYLLERSRRMSLLLFGLTIVLAAIFLVSGRFPRVRLYVRGMIGSAAFCALGAAVLGALLDKTGMIRGWSQPLVAIPILALWIPVAIRLASTSERRAHYLPPCLAAMVTALVYIQAAPGYQVAGLDVFACGFTGYFAGLIAWTLSALFSSGLRRAGVIPFAVMFLIGVVPQHVLAGAPEPIFIPRDELESMAWSDLAKQGINKDNIRTVARRQLQAAAPDEPLYDLHSVEVTGVGSNDDTEKILPNAFDEKIKPSARARRSRLASAALPWIEEFANYQQDARDAKREISGMLTNAGKSSVAPLIDKEIDRVVAHSWGTEVIYNAIFSGVIKPPRVLIILGPPDRNAEKWRILAERTGTKVMVFRAEGDPVPEVGGMFKSALSEDPEVLNQMWDKQCATVDCKPHPARRGNYESKMLFGVQGHGRNLYYDRLVEMGVIGSNLLEVQVAQENRITAAADSILESAVAQAQEMMRKSRDESIARTDAAWREAAIQRARPIPDGPSVAPAVGTAVGVGADRSRMLRSLAIGACEQPNAVNDGVVGNINLWFPSAYLPDSEKIGAPLTGCAAELYRELIEASKTWSPDRKMTVDWVKIRAHTLSRPAMVPGGDLGAPGNGKRPPSTPDHDPVWDRIGPIIGR